MQGLIRRFMHLVIFVAPLYSQVLSSGNNTAACSATNYGLLGTPYCSDTFPEASSSEPGGWNDLQTIASGSTIQTPYHNHTPQSLGYGSDWHISAARGTTWGDMHYLLPWANPTATTRIAVVVQNWFCMPATTTATVDNQSADTCNNHRVVGYSTTDQNLQNARAQDMYNRGIDVIALNWAGPGNDCPSDTTYEYGTFNASCGTNSIFYSIDTSSKLAVTSSQQAASPLNFYIQHDQASYQWACPASTGVNQPKCVTNKIETDLDSANDAAHNWFNQVNYETYTPPNHPPTNKKIVAFFQNEDGYFSQCTNTTPCNAPGATQGTLQQCVSSPDCWNVVWQRVREHLGSILGVNNFYMIFYNQGGCPIITDTKGKANSDGCYEWVNSFHPPNGDPSQVTNTTQQYANTAQPNLHNFYWATQGYLSKLAPNGSIPLVMGAAFKGFDDRFANWTTVRVITQNSGATWVNSWTEMTYNGYFGASNPIPYMIVPTWDDYEEGTEIETGIESGGCSLNVSLTTDASNQPTSVNWTWADPTTAFDHFEVWQGDANGTVKLSDLPMTARSLNLGPQLACPMFTVRAVGKPSLRDRTKYVQSSYETNGQICLTRPPIPPRTCY
jgi:hypothetical protein